MQRITRDDLDCMFIGSKW